MRVIRLYTDQPIEIGAQVVLDERAFKHLQVLRPKLDQVVTLFNGDGNDYPGRVVEIAKKNISIEIVSGEKNNTESPLYIHLGIAVSRGERMDWVMQKCTELGVTEITPLLTDRIEVKLSQERWQKRYQHWQGVLIHACEQSGRSVLPQLHQFQPLNDWLSNTTTDVAFVLDPLANDGLATIKTVPKSVSLLVGPEGGLADIEIDQAKESQFLPLSLGPRILRTETAPVAAISIMQSRWGDLT